MLSLRCGLLLLTVFAVLTGCAQVDVKYVAPDFPNHQYLNEPLSIVESQPLSPGVFAVDLANRLVAKNVRAVAGHTQGRYQMIIGLAGDYIEQDVDYDTDCSTRKVRDRKGKVVDRYEVIDRYISTSITERTFLIDYRIYDTGNGSIVWSARGEYSATNENSQSLCEHYPSPPPFPVPPRIEEIVAGMNKVTVRKLVSSLR